MNEEMVQCEMTGDYYEPQHCVYDKDGANWVVKFKVDEYLENFKRDMLIEDFETLKQDLYKQL